jgi:hypothetical protein
MADLSDLLSQAVYPGSTQRFPPKPYWNYPHIPLPHLQEVLPPGWSPPTPPPSADEMDRIRRMMEEGMRQRGQQQQPPPGLPPDPSENPFGGPPMPRPPLWQEDQLLGRPRMI